MPAVPTYDNAKVAPSPGQAPQVQDPYSSGALRLAKAVGAEQGQQASQTGMALTEAGDGMGNIAQDQQLEVNATRLADAENQTLLARNQLTSNDQRTGFRDQAGADALPINGKGLADTYGEKFQSQIDGIAGNLSNDAQKRAYAVWSAQQATNFREEASNHAAQQFQTYQGSTWDAMMSTNTDTVSKSYDNPDMVQQSLDNIRGAALSKAKLAGQSPLAGDVYAQNKTSAALTTVVKNLVDQGDFKGAQNFYDKWNTGNNFTAEDSLAISKAMKNEADLGAAQAAVANASTLLSRQISPTDFDRMQGITAMSESGGHETDAKGNTVTSGKGAQGVMQVMPTTNVNPGFGVRPAQDDSAAERARVGRDYLAAMVKRYGDPAQAWAAYNAGPGRLDDALAAAKKDGSDWLSHMPAETQKYVTGNMQALNAGGGKLATPTEDDYVSKAVEQLGANPSPNAVKLATSLASQQYERDRKSAAQADDANYSTALQAMISNKVGFYDLPPSIRNAVPAEKQKELVDFSNTLQKGPVESNPAVYLKLTDPGTLKGLSDDQLFALRTQLSDGDYKHFADERSKLLDPTKVTGKAAIGDVDRGSLNAALDTRLQQIGINPKPKANDVEGQQRIGAINKYATDSLLQAQATAGHKFSDAEMGRHLDSLFLKDVQFKSNLFGFDTSSSKRMLGMTYNDIPDADRAAIVKAFTERGIANPSHGDVLNTYFEGKSSTNANKPQSYSAADLQRSVAAKFGGGNGH